LRPRRSPRGGRGVCLTWWRGIGDRWNLPRF